MPNLSPLPSVNSNIADAQPITPAKWDPIPELLFVRMQRKDVGEVVDALEALDELISVNENAKQNLEEATLVGAHTVVIMTMNKYPYQEDVQACGCFCLANLLHRRYMMVRSATVRSGGMEAILTALSLFPHSNDVQCGGFTALVKLFAGLDEDNASEEVQRAAHDFVHGLHGLELVATAMQEFPQSGTLQYGCCELCYRLALKKEFKAQLQAAGTVSAVGAAFETHRDHPGVNAVATAFMKLIFNPSVDV